MPNVIVRRTITEKSKETLIMDISVTASPSRAAYVTPQANTAQAEKKMSAAAPARAQDEIMLSPEAQETQAVSAASVNAVSEEQAGSGSTAFTSFAEEFNKITQDYAGTIRKYYAAEHEENLTYDSPGTHIWDKYKNADSPDFRADMSEDERAWAFDQELDLFNGGKHLQMRNPYAFASTGGPPTLASAAMQANQACREQIGQAIQDLFAGNGIEVPADASFRLTVNPSDYSIHVTGLEDKELAGEMEKALNQGENGKNLYNHLKLTSPDGGILGIDYADGHLEALDSQWEMDDKVLSEVKKQAGPIWARYSSTYDPHQKAMNVNILSLDPDCHLTQEQIDCISSAVRVGAPEVVAEFRAHQQDLSLVINQNRDIDPDGSIALKTYMQAYALPAVDARKRIEDYYAEAHAENSSYPLEQGLEHIAEKYKHPGSDIFLADMTEDQRDMAYRQERALLTGARLTLFDPYALSSFGGILTAQACHQYAMQAVSEKLNELRHQMYGVK